MYNFPHRTLNGEYPPCHGFVSKFAIGADDIVVYLSVSFEVQMANLHKIFVSE